MRATLITGASMGIGEAFAREFARRGNSLVLVARSGERLAALAEELRSRKVEVLVCRQDLSLSDAPRRIHEFCRTNTISVDILVNCAGLSHASDFAAISPEKGRGTYVGQHAGACSPVAPLCCRHGGRKKGRNHQHCLSHRVAGRCPVSDSMQPPRPSS